MIVWEKYEPPLQSVLRKLSRFSWTLFALVVTLSAVGVLALYSVAGGSFTPWALQQVYRLAAGFAVMFAVALVPIQYWRSAALPVFLAALLLVGLSTVYGVSVKGAQRWLDLGLFRIQPSEFTKISVILVIAAYYEFLPKEKVSHPIWVTIPAAAVLVPSLLTAIQPDLGTSALIVAGGGIVMFLGGVSLLYFVAVIAVSGAAVAAVMLSRGKSWQILQDYQYNRIDTFLAPETDPLGAGYHITQSKIAIGSGGLNGRGFLQGTQSQLNFLPEKHTDFVFTTLAEEFGLFWCLILIAFYAVIVLICMTIALRCKDRFCALLVLGLAGTFFLYFAANLAMITGLIPVVGVPLPFISYGGSSLLVLMVAFGLIQSVHIHAERH